MAITSEIDHVRDLTTHTVRGKTSATDLEMTLTAFFTGNPTSRVLWDFSEARAAGKIVQGDLEKIAKMVKENQDWALHGKTALVAPSDLAFGLGRTYEMLAELEGVPHPIKVFRSIEAATKWLQTSE